MREPGVAAAVGYPVAHSLNGLDMLLWQAIATWKIWFGRLADRSVLKRVLKEELCHFVI